MHKNKYYLFELSVNILIIIMSLYPASSYYNNTQHATVFPVEFNMLKEWFMSLGAKYNVNPWIFGGIYVGAIPFFAVSITKLISNIKKGKPIALPAISAGFFFISAYLYLIVSGRNVPLWVYGFVFVMIIYGVYSTIKKIKKQTGK